MRYLHPSPPFHGSTSAPLTLLSAELSDNGFLCLPVTNVKIYEVKKSQRKKNDFRNDCVIKLHTFCLGGHESRLSSLSVIYGAIKNIKESRNL